MFPRPPTPGDRRAAPPGDFVGGVKKIARATGIPQQVSDAYWSVTHPRDRVMGRGRSKNQQMIWPGPFKLRPGAVIATRNPEWEIIRNKHRDTVISLSGRQSYWPAQRGAWDIRQRRNDVRMYGADESQRAYYEAALRQAIRDRHAQGLDLAFSAVPAGTREAHATIGLQIKPDHTFVDWVAALMDPFTQQGERRLANTLGPMGMQGYQPRRVPGGVMMELMNLAKAPEKPIRSWVVNEKLKKMIARYAEHDPAFDFQFITPRDM